MVHNGDERRRSATPITVEGTMKKSLGILAAIVFVGALSACDVGEDPTPGAAPATSVVQSRSVDRAPWCNRINLRCPW